jgi:hypothetical protein
MKYWQEMKIDVKKGHAPQSFARGLMEKLGEDSVMSEVQAAFLAGSKPAIPQHDFTYPNN